MSETKNNENAQIIVEYNNQNLINNNQHNLVVAQNGENNIPLTNEPFMGPQDNIQLNNPQSSNKKTKKKHSLPCLFLICFSVCIIMFGVSIASLYLVAYLIGSAMQGNFDWWE